MSRPPFGGNRIVVARDLVGALLRRSRAVGIAARHPPDRAKYRSANRECHGEYVAFYTWLGKPTFKDRGLGRANIDLYQDKKLIGSARYVIPREPRDGRVDPERAISTKAKLDPLLDELFKYFPGRKGQ